MDGLHRVIAVRRYDAARTDANADGANRPGQEKFLAAPREQIIEKQLRRLRMPRRDGDKGDARHQNDVVGRKDDANRRIFLGSLDRITGVVSVNGYVNCVPYSYYPENPTATTQAVSTAVRTDEGVTVTTGTAHGFSAGDQVTVTTVTDLSMNGDFIIASEGSVLGSACVIW